jgi:hypothetical protein
MATILTERSCQHAAAPSEAEPADEVFEIVNEQGEVIGLEKRGVVHKTGLLHKAVYCFVFDTQGRLLIQRRSLEKKIGPGQWDLSVAEHLSPGDPCSNHLHHISIIVITSASLSVFLQGDLYVLHIWMRMNGFSGQQQ